jgi:hypothetical protein
MIEIYFIHTMKMSDLLKDENITLDGLKLSFKGVEVLYLHDNSRKFLLAGRPLHDDAKKFMAYIYTNYKILSGYDGYCPTEGGVDGGYAAIQESIRFKKILDFKNKTPYEILADYYHAVDTLTVSEFMDEETIKELTEFRDKAKIDLDEMEEALEKINEKTNV